MRASGGADVSFLFGILYLVMWAATPWPQLLTTQKRRSVSGLSLDFTCYNLFGFLAYALYNGVLFASASAASAFEARFAAPPAVRMVDVVFAISGLFAASIAAAQAIAFRSTASRRLRPVAWIVPCSFVLVLLFLVSTRALLPIEAVVGLGLLKSLMSFLKYLPQLLLNRQRAATTGLEVLSTWLDFGGSFACLAQMAIEAGSLARLLTTNAPKLLLGIESALLTGTMLVQHYVLYRRSPGATDLTRNSIRPCAEPRGEARRQAVWWRAGQAS